MEICEEASSFNTSPSIQKEIGNYRYSKVYEKIVCEMRDKSIQLLLNEANLPNRPITRQFAAKQKITSLNAPNQISNILSCLKDNLIKSIQIVKLEEKTIDIELSINMHAVKYYHKINQGFLESMSSSRPTDILMNCSLPGLLSVTTSEPMPRNAFDCCENQFKKIHFKFNRTF